MAARTFQDLEVWQKARRWVLEIHRLTKLFPREERFGLTSQFRRAAISVAANIAEGFIKRSAADRARFYNISQGSLEECRYYLILAKDLSYADTQEALVSLEEVSRMLRSYTQAVLDNPL